MISLKKLLLTEDVKYVLKKSPNSIISKAANLLAGVFRVKFQGKDDDAPVPIQDVLYVLNSPKNTQFGSTSAFANGEWYYIISDDLKKSSKKMVNDILIYPKTKKVSVGRGETIFENVEDLFKPGSTPREVGNVGQSIVTTISSFIAAIDPKAKRIYQLKTSQTPVDLGTGETLINQIKEILNNTVTDSPSSDEKEIVVVKKDGGGSSSSDTKEKTEESRFKPGDTFVNASETRITLFKLKDTFNPKTDIKTTTNSNNVTYDEINGLFSNSRYVDSTPEWLKFESEMFRPVDEFEFIDETTPLNTKYKGFTQFRRITKEQYDRLVKQINDKQPITTDLDTFFSGKEQSKKETQSSSLEKLSFKTDKGEDKALSKEELLALLPEINKTQPDAETAKVFQQLIMQRVINSKIMVDGKQYTLKEIIPSVKDFANIAKPVDGIWGNKSKAVIRDLNKGFFKVQNSTDVTEQLIDRLLSPIKSESKLSLKSILLELNLREQDFSGFDVSAVTTPTPVTTTKKEVPKTTTSTSTKTVPKTTEPAKSKTPEKAKAPDKTKKSDTATLLGQRRGIDKIAQATGGKLYYSEKLKVWYIDLEIRIVRGPAKIDADGLLHMRDDGTISVTSEGKQIVQGIGSGWTEGGKKLITKTGTYTSNLPAGDAIFDTLFQAIRANAGAWKDKTLNLQIGINKLSFRSLPEQPSLKPKATTTKSTTKTSTKTSTQAQKPAPKRFIQDVAKALNVTASYDSKLKVWWFDATLLLKRSPAAFDQNAFLHVRDDGTIIVKVKGATILRGTGSGWSDGGKRLQAKLLGKTVTEKTYVTKAAVGPAFKATLLAAIQAISPFWSATTSIKSGVYRDVLSNK